MPGVQGEEYRLQGDSQPASLPKLCIFSVERFWTISDPVLEKSKPYGAESAFADRLDIHRILGLYDGVRL